MRYQKDLLVGRDWHKLVIHDDIDKEAFLTAKRGVRGEYMHQSGGSWQLFMFTESRDAEMFMRLFDLAPDCYRGYGDWSVMKYRSAAFNRMIELRGRSPRGKGSRQRQDDSG